MTFAKGAALKDPSGLFNSSLDGNVRRAIDIHEGDNVDEAALKDLIRAAVALNLKARASRSPGERAASGPTSFIAGSRPYLLHRGRASAPASYPKQFGIETPHWPPKAAQKS